MKFDIEFEEEILSRCLRDQSFLKNAAPLLEAHHFGSKQHAWIWKTIKYIWDNFREKPSGKLIVMRAKHDFSREEELKTHIELISKVAKKRGAAKASLNELELFVRAVNAQRVLEESAKELEKGRINKAWDVLNRASREDVKPRNYQVIRWIEEFEERQRERKFNAENPKSITRIPTGFKQLDNLLAGGIEIGELGLILGTTGKGKSIMLNNLAYWAAASGFPTVYFTLEMKARQIAQRTDSRWSMFEYSKFKRYDFKPSELRRLKSKMKYAMKRFADKLIIVESPVRKTMVSDLERVLDDLSDDYGFVPKLIVVDSGDHMVASRRYESYRLEQADVYWNLSGLAQQGYGVWSSVHAGREYVKILAHAEAASESYDKSRIADIVISLNTPEKKSRSTKITTDEEDEEDTPVVDGRYMELLLAKYRDGEDKVIIPVDAVFSNIRIKPIEKED